MIKEILVDQKKITYYYQQNDGKPVLLMIHGWSGSYSNWANVLPFLGKDFEIIALNLPGCAGSDELDVSSTIKHYSKFLSEFIHVINKNEINILAESIG